MPETLEELRAEYEEYLETQQLPKECAEELLAGTKLTAEQTQWLVTFSGRWRVAQKAEDSEKFGCFFCGKPVPKYDVNPQAAARNECGNEGAH